MADGYDYTQDPAFQAASPSDQMHFMMGYDQHFAAASPQDQLAYLAHIRGIDAISDKVPLGVTPPSNPAPPKGTLPQGPTDLLTRMWSGPQTPPQAGRATSSKVPLSIQGAPDELGETIAGTAVGAGAVSLGAYGASAVAPTVGKIAAKHPLATSILMSEGIRQARQIPYVGKMIPPYSEMLPYLMTGGKPAESAPAGKPTFPGASLPETPSPELMQSRSLAEGAQSSGGPYLKYNPKIQTPPLPASQTGEALASRPPTTLPNYTPVEIGKGATAGLNRHPDGPYSGPNTPVMETVQSGQIYKSGYHSDSGTMVVEFHGTGKPTRANPTGNNPVYELKGVPEEIYNQYKSAPSQGSYYAQNLKGRYETNLRGFVKPSPGARAKQALASSAPQQTPQQQ